MVKFENELALILEACENKKAYDFSLINISELTSLCDYFLIFIGNNEKQTVAIADEIIDKLNEFGLKVNHKEGYRSGRWILLDYGFVIVHIFHKDERYFYSLESLWGDGETIDVERFGIKNWK